MTVYPLPPMGRVDTCTTAVLLAALRKRPHYAEIADAIAEHEREKRNG